MVIGFQFFTNTILDKSKFKSIAANKLNVT